MTIKRLLVLLAVLGAGMSLIFLLPIVPNTQPVGIDLKLPSTIGHWQGKDEAVTEKEITTLGPETEFARKVYSNDRNDEIHVSIVLGGHDMNTSIHRPERCLPAQGWTIVNSSKLTIPVQVPEDELLKVTRLYNLRPIQNKEGHPFKIYSLNYYWFVGSTETTASHFTRTLFDVRDRLLKGYNQRWAYITVAAVLKNEVAPERDQQIKEFIQELVPIVHRHSLKYQ